MSEVREPSEKTRLKHEARYLRKQIAKANALIRQRQKVQSMRGKLEDLQYALANPDAWNGGPIT